MYDLLIQAHAIWNTDRALLPRTKIVQPAILYIFKRLQKEGGGYSIRPMICLLKASNNRFS